MPVLGLGGDDPLRLGPYRLKAVVGDGGMGRVYLATSPAGRAVAVKVIRRGLADQPGYRERFAREARAAMSVSGLYTASVVDADTAGQSPYIATEFVPAPSLAEAVGQSGPLPADTVLALAGGMAEALVAIHRAGLVHRDVKPHNILLAADGPVVIDFGIAVGDEAALTATGIAVGTPGYMAPEVLHGSDPSPVSDLFALGCVLVYAARGTGPFGTGDALVIAHRAAAGEPDLAGVPEPVRALVAPLLHRDPARRPTPAQLLQHVSVSSTAVLHDGLWLPEGVRAMLEQRRQEVQRVLSGSSVPAQPPAAPTALPPPQWAYPAAAQAEPIPAPHAAATKQAGPGLPPPYSGPPAGTPAQDFAAVHGGAPARTSKKGFFAAVGLGGAVVLVGAILAVVLLSNGNGDGAASSNTTHSGQAAGATTQKLAAGASSPAGSAGSTPADPSPTASVSSTASTSSADDGVGSYRPGVYRVNQHLATDYNGDTVVLTSITVADDGSVSAQLTYTSAVSGSWTCAAATPGQGQLSVGSGPIDSSTGSTCTEDPTRTMWVDAGGSFVLSQFFSGPPSGSGPWTFAFNSANTSGVTEFSGTVSGIQIPTS